VPSYIPTNNEEVFLFPTSSPACVVVCVIDDNHFGWSEVESQYCLICISFMDKDVEHFFMYLFCLAFKK
jgi:hypothetical protein